MLVKDSSALLICKKYVNTLPDRALKKARQSKLGAIAKGPSVEDPDMVKQPVLPKYTEAVRDYKYVNFFLF